MTLCCFTSRLLINSSITLLFFFFTRCQLVRWTALRSTTSSKCKRTWWDLRSAHTDPTYNKLARLMTSPPSNSMRTRARSECGERQDESTIQSIRPLYDFIVIFIVVVFVLFLVGWSGAQSSWNAWVWRDHDPSASRSHRFVSMNGVANFSF